MIRLTLLGPLLLLLLICGCYGNLSTSGAFKFIKYLNHPPEIVVRPRPQVVRAGGVAIFLCSARGDPAPQLRWRRRARTGSAAQLGDRIKVLQLPGGARLLRVQKVQHRDNATFICVAENSAGDAVSAEATLSVLDAGAVRPGFPAVSPSIAEPATTRVVEVGHSAVLPCSASGSAPLLITWLKNGVPLHGELAFRRRDPQRIFVLASGSRGSLNVTSARESDKGRYECVAENEVGSQFSAPIELFVKVPRVRPAFTNPLPPPDVEVPIGGAVNLTCGAAGSPMPSVQWRPSGAVGDDVMLGDQAQDDQEDPDEEDNELPLPEQVDVPETDDASYEDEEDGDEDDEEDEEDSSTATRDGGRPGTATLQLLDIKASVNYTCIATSTLGEIHSVTRIRVQTLPGPPSGLRASDITSSSARLSWRGPPDEPREYVLQYRTRGRRGQREGAGRGRPAPPSPR